MILCQNKPKVGKKEEIRNNLRKVADLIIDEDQANRATNTVGECMEYFLKHHIFESLIAYAKSNKPPGFFNFAMNIIIELLENIEWVSLISQKSVHPAINQMLQMFEVTVKDKYVFKHYDTTIILDFLNVLCHKIAKMPYLSHLMFSNAKRLGHHKSEKGDYLPLKVVMRLLQDMTAKDNPVHWNRIYDTLKWILKINNPLVDEYINNESEICEILVNTLERFFHWLPTSLIVSERSSFSVKSLVKENFPQSEDKNNFYFSYLKFVEFLKFLGESCCNFLDALFNTNPNILNNITSIFFNEFLLRLQENLLDDDRNLLRFRTTLQYLIDIADLINHQSVYEMIFFFLFGFPEKKQKSDSESGLVTNIFKF